jgi:hypothetical protein
MVVYVPNYILKIISEYVDIYSLYDLSHSSKYLYTHINNNNKIWLRIAQKLNITLYNIRNHVFYNRNRLCINCYLIFGEYLDYFDEHICDKCLKSSKYALISKKDAKYRFKLTNSDIKHIPGFSGKSKRVFYRRAIMLKIDDIITYLNNTIILQQNNDKFEHTNIYHNYILNYIESHKYNIRFIDIKNNFNTIHVDKLHIIFLRVKNALNKKLLYKNFMHNIQIIEMRHVTIIKSSKRFIKLWNLHFTGIYETIDTNEIKTIAYDLYKTYIHSEYERIRSYFFYTNIYLIKSYLLHNHDNKFWKCVLLKHLYIINSNMDEILSNISSINNI